MLRVNPWVVAAACLTFAIKIEAQTANKSATKAMIYWKVSIIDEMWCKYVYGTDKANANDPHRIPMSQEGSVAMLAMLDRLRKDIFSVEWDLLTHPDFQNLQIYSSHIDFEYEMIGMTERLENESPQLRYV